MDGPDAVQWVRLGFQMAQQAIAAGKDALGLFGACGGP